VEAELLEQAIESAAVHQLVLDHQLLEIVLGDLRDTGLDAVAVAVVGMALLSSRWRAGAVVGGVVVARSGSLLSPIGGFTGGTQVRIDAGVELLLAVGHHQRRAE